MKPTYTYRAVLLAVTDGDTLRLRIDVGFRVWVETPVRLLGLNAPEHNTPAGKSATAWVIDWMAQHPDLVVTTLADPEKYGRWLATVTDESDGTDLNAALIASGHALAWDGKGPRPG